MKFVALLKPSMQTFKLQVHPSKSFRYPQAALLLAVLSLYALLLVSCISWPCCSPHQSLSHPSISSSLLERDLEKKVHTLLESEVDLPGCILGILAQNAGTAHHQSAEKWEYQKVSLIIQEWPWKILVVLSLLDTGSLPSPGCPCIVVLEVRQEERDQPPQSQGSTSLQPWPACLLQTGLQIPPGQQQSLAGCYRCRDQGGRWGGQSG